MLFWERELEQQEMINEQVCLETQRKVGVSVVDCNGAECQSICPFKPKIDVDRMNKILNNKIGGI